jgi:glycosyltransferase involved in cell wall biosynthesis
MPDRAGPVRIIGLDLEPLRDFRTQHTRQAGVYRALDADPRFQVLRIATPTVSLPLLRLIQLAYFRPERERWRARSGLSSAGFRARTRSAERLLSRYEDYDVIFQVGCMFAPGRSLRRRPYTQYLDSTLLLMHRHWPLAASHGRRALRSWISREREVYRGAAHIFTMSEWTRDSVIADYEIDPGKVTTAGVGANMIAAEEAVSHQTAPIALFVGQNFSYKGGPTLLDAWQQVRREVPGAQLWIVGTPDEPRTENEVTWHGRVDPDALRALYRKASVFVLPTTYDRSPHVLREALGHGLPCVTTEVGAIPETVRDGVDSVVVAPGDSAALAQALAKLLAEPDTARRMGAAGRERVLREATWARVGERMASHILRAAGRA